MSIRALENIKHDGASYKNGDEITDITKDEAFRLVNLKVAEIIDDKFKLSKNKIKKNIQIHKKIKKIKEDEFRYAKS